MKRGILLHIPNGYGSFIGDVLAPIDIASYDWFNGGEEAYFIENETLGAPLFPEMVCGMDGKILERIVRNNRYYVIFADLKAYPKGEFVADLGTYEEYMQSECQLALLVADSSYMTIYCKDADKLEELYENAANQADISVEYITDDNDSRTGLANW